MEQKMNELLAKLEADNSLGEKLFLMETPEEVQTLLKEQGLEFSLEEIGMLKEVLIKSMEKGGSGELSDEDLENVAGGSITVLAICAIIGAIAGAVTAAGTVTDQAVRSRW
ncbi:hypothetical protein ASZ90_019992 [hydrocarbon metagenome]|uniref:Nif11 domain-containing protein n=1 Tax=hydrocarbon metagenome TaxID=938273 RepID=A0A0W8E1V8_9ZZZZ